MNRKRRPTRFLSAPARRRAPPATQAWLAALAFVLALAALVGAAAFYQARTRADGPESGRGPVSTADPARPGAVSALRGLGYPTPQRRLLGPGWEEGVQPTAAGRPESALYGSTRTGSDGLASFHEGVDIAVTERDSRGRPLDPVVAVADGRIAHVNRVAGNSNYGLYVVLLHPDPVGEVFTLYAHLAELAGGLTPGAPVARGARLGTVGNTPTSIIPLARAHLHFEIGLVVNSGFAQWAKRRKTTNPHGNYNGRNLAGLDPLAILAQAGADPDFSLLAHLRGLPPAISLVVHGRRGRPDFFRRYPALWSGTAPVDGGAMVLTFSEGGVPLAGRPADEAEHKTLGRRSAAVLDVHEQVLGRNGRRLVIRRNGRWEIGYNGEQWLEQILE